MKKRGLENQGGDRSDGKQDEDYILGKLFQSDSVQGAIQHDIILDQSQGTDYVLAEKEAEK